MANQEFNISATTRAIALAIQEIVICWGKLRQPQPLTCRSAITTPRIFRIRWGMVTTQYPTV